MAYKRWLPPHGNTAGGQRTLSIVTVTQLDVLNAISTRFARGYTTSTDDDVADELATHESNEVSRQLEIAHQAGLVRLMSQDADGAPRYAITEDGERLVTDALNE